MGDVVRVVLTDPAGVGLLGAPEVGRDILYGLAVVASAGAAFAGHISSLCQHFDRHGMHRYCQVIRGNFGRFLAILGDFERFWVIFGRVALSFDNDNTP